MPNNTALSYRYQVSMDFIERKEYLSVVIS